MLKRERRRNRGQQCRQCSLREIAGLRGHLTLVAQVNVLELQCLKIWYVTPFHAHVCHCNFLNGGKRKMEIRVKN